MFSLSGVKKQLADAHQAWRYAARRSNPLPPSSGDPSADVAPEAVVEARWGMRRSLRPSWSLQGPRLSLKCESEAGGVSRAVTGRPGAGGALGPGGDELRLALGPGSQALCGSGSLPLLQWDVNSAWTCCYSFLSVFISSRF